MGRPHRCQKDTKQNDASFYETYEVTAKNAKNKTVYCKQTVECQHLILWPGSQNKVHCHTAELGPNRGVSIDEVPLSDPTFSGPCTLKLGHDRFLPHPFQFIIHLSSFHLTLYSLSLCFPTGGMRTPEGSL